MNYRENATTVSNSWKEKRVKNPCDSHARVIHVEDISVI